ncbi:Histone-lysine N-methyltransferase SETMAR [Eumeta japonica]|uniref:Histone-lysine N-methyltransferase SETMAR n=1 Tax=Eumeta variegata TaxID=151549 RepID=A0A4C1ZEI6_EUMVA|nr:Histone-lysine N-methyltransferase SETMAR [Eumeta japonica]
MAGIRDAGFETLKHPIYSPDLSLTDFQIFPSLKKYLKGQRFEDDEEVVAAVQEFLVKRSGPLGSAQYVPADCHYFRYARLLFIIKYNALNFAVVKLVTKALQWSKISGGATPLVDVGDIRREAVGGRRRLAPPLSKIGTRERMVGERYTCALHHSQAIQR